MGDKTEPDRPVCYVETAAYDVRVWGKQADELSDVLDAVDVACDRAMEDARKAAEHDNDARIGTQ